MMMIAAQKNALTKQIMTAKQKNVRKMTNVMMVTEVQLTLVSIISANMKQSAAKQGIISAQTTVFILLL